MPYLGSFRLRVEKTIVIFEISTLAFVEKFFLEIKILELEIKNDLV